MANTPQPTLSARCVLAVCAHPDDESFGLGGILANVTANQATAHLLCFTSGEASTLGANLTDLAHVRAAELEAAAAVLGISTTRLCGYADGHLTEADLDTLVSDVVAVARNTAADCLLVFDPGGITGHPDHQRATEAALIAAGQLGIPVLAWALSPDVATPLHTEFGVQFVAAEHDQIHIRLVVDRTAQLAAIACHTSQSPNNPVLRRRLELQGDIESLRWLAPPAAR